MPPTRDELHRLIDELPTEMIEAGVGQALLAASARAAEDVRRHSERTTSLAKLGPDELRKRHAELRSLAADVQALSVRLTEFEWMSPELQRATALMQTLAAKFADWARWNDAPWDDIEAAHARGEVIDPFLLALLNAPEDDEPETDEERAAVEEAHEAIRRGETRPWVEVRRELEAEAKHG